MKTNPPSVSVHTDREEAALVLRENYLTAVPVVDGEERLVGIITYDDVVDILEQEATEDIYRFGAVPGTERGHFASRILTVVRRRVVWLLLLILVNTVTGLVIARQRASLPVPGLESRPGHGLGAADNHGAGHIRDSALLRHSPPAALLSSRRWVPAAGGGAGPAAGYRAEDATEAPGPDQYR